MRLQPQLPHALPSTTAPGTACTDGADAVAFDDLVRQVAAVIQKQSLPLRLREHAVVHDMVVLKYDLADGGTLADVARRRDDLLYHLAAYQPSLDVPMPGENRIGLYLSLGQRRPLDPTAGLRVVATADMALPVYAGLTLAAEHHVFDLAVQPHLLVAGASGSGKSAFVTTMILSLLCSRNAPFVRFVFIDPKRVELAPFASLPHRACRVVCDPPEVEAVLALLVQTMEQRYQALQRAGCHSIDSYRQSAPKGRDKTYVVVVIDEAADLFLTAGRAVQRSVVLLAQKSRAVGIHIVMATQRPSADLITGDIKANFPARIAFQTAGKVDSRLILDEDGAAALRGRGDGLLKTVGTPGSAVRFQAPWVAPADLPGMLSRLDNGRTAAAGLRPSGDVRRRRRMFGR